MTVSAAPAPPITNRPLATLAGAFAAQWITGFGFVTFTLLAPFLAIETGLKASDFGLSVTFFFIGTALSSPMSGAMVRRIGSVATLVTAMSFMACVYLVCLFGTWWSVMLASLLFGLGYGPQGPVGMTLVTQHTPATRRGLFLSLRQAAQPFAAVISGRLLPPMMALVGWQSGVIATSTMLALGALMVIAAFPLFRVQQWRAPAAKPQRNTVSRYLTSVVTYFAIPRGLRLLFGAGLVLAISQMAMMIYAYLFLIEVVKLTPIQAGIFVSNQQLAGMIGRPIFGWFCDASGRSMQVLGFISLTTILTIVALSYAAPGMPGWQLFILAIATGIAGQTWNSVFTTAMSYRVPPQQLTEYNGRAFSFLSFGWMATPLLFWILINASGGYELPFFIVLVANAFAVVALFMSGGPPDRKIA